MTEHRDPIVEAAIEVLESCKKSLPILIDESIEALKKGRKYNCKQFQYADYAIGFNGQAMRLLEPFTRLQISGDNAQARDVVAYAGLFTQWIQKGMPPSTLELLVDAVRARLYERQKERDTGRGGVV